MSVMAYRVGIVQQEQEIRPRVHHISVIGEWFLLAFGLNVHSVFALLASLKKLILCENYTQVLWTRWDILE